MAALAPSHPIYSETRELNMKNKFLIGVSFLLGYGAASLGRPFKLSRNVVKPLASEADSYPTRTETSSTRAHTPKNLRF